MTLLLRSCDLIAYTNTSQTTSIFSTEAGYCNGARTDLIFYINLKTLLGKEYDEYDFFNLELQQLNYVERSSGQTGTLVNFGTPNRYNLGFEIGGVNFISGQPTELIANFTIPNNLIGAVRFFENANLVFQKSEPNIQLEINVINALTGQRATEISVTSAAVFPQFALLCKITGLNQTN